MDISTWIQGIGIVVVLFVGIGLMNNIIERVTKPLEEIKDKLDEILMYTKDSTTHLQDISENTLLSRPNKKSLLTDEDRKRM